MSAIESMGRSTRVRWVAAAAAG
ncbi:MAG: hypothetical protein RLZ83_1083, partial [Pseudomonadota bacterium]